MQNFKKTEKTSSYLPFIMVSVIFTIIGIALLIKGIIFYHNAESVKAQIVSVQEYYTTTKDSRGNRHRERHEEVYVTYEYNGKLYSNVLLGSVNLLTKKVEGDTINIYVNSKNPEDTSDTRMPSLGFIFLFVGGGSTAFLSYKMITTARKGRKENIF